MNQPFSYYDTTNEPIQLRIEFEQKAKHQEKVIYALFNGAEQLSPSTVLKRALYFRRLPADTPLTSIRRAITNLTKQGRLRKTNVKVTGIYGRQEYCWEKI